MTGPVQLALALGPLAVYLFVLSIWHGRSHPRVVSGLADFTLLALGVGGLLLFGPVGLVLSRMLFRKPDLLDWMALASGLGLVATLFARRALRRLVVYHVDEATLAQALREVLDQGHRHFEPSLGGFEDRAGARGLRVEVAHRGHAVLIEAVGRDPEILIQELRPRLRDRLRNAPAPTMRVAWAFLVASWLVGLIPPVVALLGRPRVREAIRGLFDRLHGG